MNLKEKLNQTKTICRIKKIYNSEITIKKYNRNIQRNTKKKHTNSKKMLRGQYTTIFSGNKFRRF